MATRTVNCGRRRDGCSRPRHRSHISRRSGRLAPCARSMLVETHHDMHEATIHGSLRNGTYHRRLRSDLRKTKGGSMSRLFIIQSFRTVRLRTDMESRGYDHKIPGSRCARPGMTTIVIQPRASGPARRHGLRRRPGLRTWQSSSGTCRPAHARSCRTRPCPSRC